MKLIGGCLGSIIRKVIIILIIIAFFTLGGYGFLKDKINSYKNPPRDIFIETEKNYGDLSSLSSDYQLSRCFSFFGYRKISAKYLPTNQKITVYDLKNEEKLTPNDFKTGLIDEKINSILSNLKDSIITFEDFEIIERGSYQAQNKEVPFIKFSAKVKNIPFKTVRGVLCAYSSKNSNGNISTKLVVNIADTKAYNPVICADFIKALKF